MLKCVGSRFRGGSFHRGIPTYPSLDTKWLVSPSFYLKDQRVVGTGYLRNPTTISKDETTGYFLMKVKPYLTLR